MLRRFVCASVVLVIGLGVVMADEFQATILKVDGNKVTFKKGKKGGGEEATLPVAKDAKIMKGKFNMDTKKLEADTAIEGGLKNEMFTNIKISDEGKGGVNATITTDADNKNITAITTGGKGGKGKGKKNQN